MSTARQSTARQSTVPAHRQRTTHISVAAAEMHRWSGRWVARRKGTHKQSASVAGEGTRGIQTRGWEGTDDTQEWICVGAPTHARACTRTRTCSAIDLYQLLYWTRTLPTYSVCGGCTPPGVTSGRLLRFQWKTPSAPFIAACLPKGCAAHGT